MTTAALANITLVSEVSLAQGRANVVDCEFLGEAMREECGQMHRVGISLTTLPRRSEGRFKVAGCARGRIGRMVFLPAGIPLEATNGGGFQRIAGVHFTVEDWYEVAGRTAEFSNDELNRSLDLNSADLDFALRRIGREILSPGFASEALIESLMTLVLIDLERAVSRAQPSGAFRSGGLSARKLALVEERIRAESLQIPSAMELAELAGLSVRHLLRCYRQEAGENLRESLQRESSARAQYLLRGTDLPIKTISWQLGFRSQGNFTNAFQRMHGETPSRYRSRFR